MGVANRYNLAYLFRGAGLEHDIGEEKVIFGLVMSVVVFAFRVDNNIRIANNGTKSGDHLLAHLMSR